VENWPTELKKFLQEMLGPATRTDYMSGVAGSGCVRVWSEEKSVIVKMSMNPRERMFYETYAPHLRTHSVGVPELYFSGCSAEGMHYVVIEYIPRSLPENKWMRNEAQVETLFALHHATWGDLRPNIENPYLPEWTDELTNGASAWFARSTEAQVVLERLNRAQALWERINLTCCMSGDPNPTNWRVRDDGTLVLVDWERFGYGMPAIDLAILMPGLGSPDGSLEKWLAAMYVECWHRIEGQIPMSVDVLQAQIRLAKWWSAVDFLSRAAQDPKSYPKTTVRYIVENLPSVLEKIECVESVFT
jgi:aminoglycoside phosphotransferase (APT) family kinase protein